MPISEWAPYRSQVAARCRARPPRSGPPGDGLRATDPPAGDRGHRRPTDDGRRDRGTPAIHRSRAARLRRSASGRTTCSAVRTASSRCARRWSASCRPRCSIGASAAGPRPTRPTCASGPSCAAGCRRSPSTRQSPRRTSAAAARGQVVDEFLAGDNRRSRDAWMLGRIVLWHQVCVERRARALRHTRMITSRRGRTELRRRVGERLWPVMGYVARGYRVTLVRRPRVVAVVGSVGKTTTMRTVSAVLGRPVSTTSTAEHEQPRGCWSGAARRSAVAEASGARSRDPLARTDATPGSDRQAGRRGGDRDRPRPLGIVPLARRDP